MKKYVSILAMLVPVVALTLPLTAQQSTTTSTITLRGSAAAPARVDLNAKNPEELRKSLVARFERRFDDADKDGDGTLSKVEFNRMISSDSNSIAAQVRQDHQSKPSTQTEQRTKLSEKQKADREKELNMQFDALDTNDDGSLAKEEFVDARTSAMTNALGEKSDRRQTENSGNSTRATSTRAIQLNAP